jgi:hypothetical protein
LQLSLAVFVGGASISCPKYPKYPSVDLAVAVGPSTLYKDKQLRNKSTPTGELTVKIPREVV